MNNDTGFIPTAKCRFTWLCAHISNLSPPDAKQNPPVIVERNGVLSVQPAPEPADFPATPGLDVVADYGRIGR